MMQRLFTLALIFSLAFPSMILTHEGHLHRLMGTVVAVSGSTIEVKTRENKREGVEFDKETQCRRGDKSASLADIRVGERIVLTLIEEGGKKRAREVLLGSGTGDKKEKN